MKFFAAYSAVVLLLFVGATHEGFAMSSLFGHHHHGKQGEHGYMGSSYFYHK